MTAHEIDALLGLTLTAAFLALAGAALIVWVRRRDRVLGRLGLAAAWLAVVCLSFRVDDLTASSLWLVGPVVTVAVLASGYELLMLRDVLIPISTRVKRLIAGALIGVGAYVIGVGFPLNFEDGMRVHQTVALVALSITWSACVIEPMVRFWSRSRSLPTIQRARMRALTVGYGGLVGVLVLAAAFMGGGSGTQAAEREVVVLVVALVLVVFQFVAFAPPRWLRRVWREREERALLHATGADMFAVDKLEVAATRALRWAIRLVGAEAGVLATLDRAVVVGEALSATDAADLVDGLPANGRVRIERIRGRSGPEAMVVPVRLESGVATLVVVAGPFTPPFGPDETVLLAHFGETVAAALDRLRISEIRSTFLNALSHELRTPLTTMLGLARTMQHPAADDLAPARRRDLVGAMVRNGERLERLLGDLLDVDRLSRGVLEARRRVVDAVELVCQVIDNSAAGVPRSVIFDPAAPMFVDVDPPMLERIIENLLANAAKHTPARSRTWVSLHDEDGDLVVEVADDGPGVADGVRQAIFEPFKRGPGAPAHSPGSGLGLSLVARFAQLHGGSAWVDERPGGGAAFKVRLPRAVESARAGRRLTTVRASA